MKHVITVPAPLLRAARIYQPNSDPRHYLKGVHLNPDGYVESTNGTSAFRAPCEACKSLDNPLILRIQSSTVGKGDELAHIYLDDAGLGWITFGQADKDGNPMADRKDNAGMVVRVMVQVIDGKFPGLEKIFPEHGRKLAPVSRIGIDAEYFEMAGNVIKALGFRRTQLKLEFGGETSVIFAEAAGRGPGYEHEIAIMPAAL